MTQTSVEMRKHSGTSVSAALICGAVVVLALPSAVLAFSGGIESGLLPGSETSALGFVPSAVDPRLARSITVRALGKGQLFRFTPAASPNRSDSSVVTVAVRVLGKVSSLGLSRSSASGVGDGGSALRIAPAAYSLGAARGYRGFAGGGGAAQPGRSMAMPDLAAYRPRPGVIDDPSRFSPRIALDEREKTGRSPRTFEQSDQQVDLGGSYRVTRNLNVTAGVRYSSDRDRLRPLTDGRRDNQAVYLGTQFRF